MGKTSRMNCGRCHFYGGGGDGVKHGDLDSSLLQPGKELDVHMDAKGLNYACTTCHVTKAHQISGRYYSRPAPNKHKLALPADDGDRLACESCHSRSPHKQEAILNDHTGKVACQSCHIPRYARGGVFTKMWWDWSTAGKFSENGKAIVKKDESGHLIYHSKKGDMHWSENVVPEYFWYNGSMSYLQEGEKIADPSGVLALNSLKGSYDDPQARIYPFKVMRGKQPFDPVEQVLIVPYLFGKKGSGAYWADYDWKAAAAVGMREAGLPFSGKIGFIETDMYWPITHMVAPKEKSLNCEECHRRNDGRLENLKNFYMPGRDHWQLLDSSGWVLSGLAIIALLLHAGLRFTSSSRRKNGTSQGGRS